MQVGVIQLVKEEIMTPERKESDCYLKKTNIYPIVKAGYGTKVSTKYGSFCCFCWSLKFTYHARKGKFQFVPALGRKKQPNFCLHGQAVKWKFNKNSNIVCWNWSLQRMFLSFSSQIKKEEGVYLLLIHE